MKLQNWSCDKTQKLKLWRSLKFDKLKNSYCGDVIVGGGITGGGIWVVVLVVVLLVIVFSVLEVLVQRRREGEIYGAHLVGNYLTNGLKMVRTSTTTRNTFHCNGRISINLKKKICFFGHIAFNYWVLCISYYVLVFLGGMETPRAYFHTKWTMNYS